MGEVIAFQEAVRMRRRRASRALHARCRAIIVASVLAARAELVTAPIREYAVRASRLRKLEELEVWTGTLA